MTDTTKSNSLSDINLFSTVSGALAGTRKKLNATKLPGELTPWNLLAHCSSAFRFKTSTAGAADAVVTPLWNGALSAVGATEGLGTFTFTPGFADPVITRTGAAAGDNIIPIIILDASETDSYWTLTGWVRASGITTAVILTTYDASGVVGTMSGWALFIGKRGATYDFTDGSETAESISDADQALAMAGGTQT